MKIDNTEKHLFRRNLHLIQVEVKTKHILAKMGKNNTKQYL